MQKVIIYYTEDKKIVQVIQPSEKFSGDWKGLVQNVTGSNDHWQRYHSYEVL